MPNDNGRIVCVPFVRGRSAKHSAVRRTNEVVLFCCKYIRLPPIDQTHAMHTHQTVIKKRQVSANSAFCNQRGSDIGRIHHTSFLQLLISSHRSPPSVCRSRPLVDDIATSFTDWMIDAASISLRSSLRSDCIRTDRSGHDVETTTSRGVVDSPSSLVAEPAVHSLAGKPPDLRPALSLRKIGDEDITPTFLNCLPAASSVIHSGPRACWV